jgi:carboxypeptidase D
MLEVGPFRTNGQGGLKWVEGSWDEYTTMVFGEHPYGIPECILISSLVDQPVGTGFSYTGQDNYVAELDEVCTYFLPAVFSNMLFQAAGQVVEFMRNFYSVFPEFQNMDVR